MQSLASEAIFNNLDPTASLVITIRVGFEITAPPRSAYIGQVGSPILEDKLAQSCYAAIAKEMAAAYPAEYNILGALFNVIKGIGT